MILRFETCDRRRALGFLQKLLPAYAVEDTPECAGPLLDFVAADVIRIPDPDHHPNGRVYPSKNWSDDKEKAVVDAHLSMMAALKKVDA
jgi:hypothetical protein